MCRMASLCRYFLVLAGVLWVFLPSHVFSQPAQDAPVVTKGAFVERYFVNKFTRPPAARRYAPSGVDKLSPAERYRAVVKGLTDQGVLILAGTKPGDPLTRIEFITLTYLLVGGRPTQSLGDQKALLKERGVIDPNDIGIVKSFQGDVNVTRVGNAEAVKITGAEPVLFKDLDETEFGARLELQFDDGSTLAIGEDTSVNIDEMIYDPRTKMRSIRLRLTVGTIMVNAAKNSHPDSRFVVVTPTLVAGVRGTVFGAQVDGSGKSSLLTTEGSVVVCLKRSKEELKNRLRKSATECELSDDDGKKAVLVNAGEVTGASFGDLLLRVTAASEELIQTILDETRVVGSTQVANVSSAEAAKTEGVVQVEIQDSIGSTVSSNQDTSQQRLSNEIGDDKGAATDEACLFGDNCPTAAAAAVPPSPAPLTLEEQLAGLSGQALKDFFLALTDQQQSDLFGVLTTGQQTGLVALLSQQEAQDLLARFQPNSPFTDAVLKSLLDFGAVLSASQVGQLLDNLTDVQAAEYVACNGDLRNCVGDLSNPLASPVGINLDGTRVFGLSLFGADVAEALRVELISELGLAASDTRFRYLASMLTRIIGNLDPADIQDIADIWGGGFLGYAVNGGIQAGELLQNPNGPNAGQKIDISNLIANRRLNDGFFAYVNQLGEDFLNAGALALIDSADHAAFTTQLMAQPNDRKSLLDLVTSQMEASNIRARDARLQNETDARAGAVFSGDKGNVTRAAQYVLRPQARPNQVQMVNITQTSGSEARLAYIDFRTTFTPGSLTGLTSTQIRDLPWNDYLTTLYSGNVAQCQATQSCYTMVGSPAGSAELQSMSIQQGHGRVITDSSGNPQSGFFRRSTREFASRGTDDDDSNGGEGNSLTASGYNYDGTLIDPTFEHQKVTQETFSIRNVGTYAGGVKALTDGTATVGGGITPIMNDPRAGSTLSSNAIPTGEFRSIPRQFAGNNPIIAADPTVFPSETENPEGFIHRSVGAFRRRDTDALVNFTSIERFRALGTSSDPTPGANVVTGLSGVKIDNIWDALRVGQPGVSLSGQGQGLPTIDIGGNLLQFRFSNAVYIPWNRMIWKDAE